VKTDKLKKEAQIVFTLAQGRVAKVKAARQERKKKEAETEELGAGLVPPATPNAA